MPGAFVLQHRLRVLASSFPLIVLAPPTLTDRARRLLTQIGVHVVAVGKKWGKDGSVRASCPARADHQVPHWEKLSAFGVDLDRIVMIDVDIYLRHSIDALFRLPLQPGHIAGVVDCPGEYQCVIDARRL